MRGALLIAGTSSDAGKSVLVTGICRSLARKGIAVAPFKAQNMSLNSTVTPDGAEIGRAQAAQAAAARVVPEAAMNPVLLKPGGEQSSQVIVMGHPVATADAGSYQDLRPNLLPVVIEALDSLRTRFDVVVCEGAGSLAEINLREGDLANMGLARRAGLPVVVVADIDRGGALAGLFGSLAVLNHEDQNYVSAFVLNKFRGDRSVLDPGIERLSSLTGRPVVGVIPWVPGLRMDEEDSVALDAPPAQPSPPVGRDILTVAVVQLPRISNFTDIDPLVTEPGVKVSFTASPAEVLGADLVVLPGTKATVEDLRWLRGQGLGEALKERSARSLPVIGLCGGYQMLGSRIIDDIESRAGRVEALDLLPVETAFAPDKVLGDRAGSAIAWGGAAVSGYEIRHGRVKRFGGTPLFRSDDADEGCGEGAVLGTSWHGIFESDDFRRALLRWVAEIRGLEWVPGHHSFAGIREARLDRLGDVVESYVDMGALIRLIEEGAPHDLPVLRSGLDASHVPPVQEAHASLEDLRIHGDRMAAVGKLDFAVNVVPGGPPGWLRSELSGAVGELSRYPDDAEAIQALAERHGRRPSEVLPTNGAADAFWLLASALRPRRAAVVHPTFTEPEVALRMSARNVERVFRDPDGFRLDPTVVPRDADVVFVCNPNNPSGNLDPAAALERLVRPDRIVVVDEAFMEFCPDERESLAGRSDLPGVLVVRSITKLWSLPAIRAGYLLGPPDVVGFLSALRQPWSMNALALTALVACARRRDEAAAIARETARARVGLVTALGRIPGIRVWPSVTNFVLMEVPDGPTVADGLFERGVAVRPAHSFPGLSRDYLRVAVRTPEDNHVLVTALEELLG